MHIALRARAGYTFLFVVALLAGLWPAEGRAQACRWDGTAPFCSGECGSGETEKTRSASGTGVQNLESTNPFGGDCATGTKALCCRTPGRSCRWDGTAPFCDGECQNGETRAEPPEGSSSGKACVTGSKVYCCRVTSNPNSTGQRLEAESPEFTRFAAIWEKTPGPALQARHGLTGAQFQREFDTLVRQGYRLVDISGYGVAGQDRYAAIWEQGAGPAWQARHGLNAAQYQQAFDALAGQGYRLVHVDGYNVGGQARYAAIWRQEPGPAWQARHGLNGAQFQQEFDRLAAQGYRLVDVSGYAVGGQDQYAAIWVQDNSVAWQARHGMNSAQYQQEFNRLAQEGYRLARISGWANGKDYRYAAIWVKAPGPAWAARHGLVSDSYQEEFNFMVRDGYRLRQVSGYHAGAN